MKTVIKQAFSILVYANTVIFLALAYFHMLSTDPKSAVFIDFWGRFTVYSLWFIGYLLYRKYLEDKPVIKSAVIVVIASNIPLFLLMAYFDKIDNDPKNLVFVDFWGRITVYSLWFMCYEAYRNYLLSPEEADAMAVGGRPSVVNG